MAKVSKWIESQPDEATADVAVRGLRSRLVPLQYYLTMAAWKPDEDIEYVHLLRTWSRRARAATRVFEDWLPRRRTRRLNRQLRRLRQATNDARDDDVFAVRLAAEPENPHAVRLLARVQKHRRTVQASIVDVYHRLMDGHRFSGWVTELLDRVRWRGADEDRDPPQFGPWAVERLRLAVTEFSAAGEALSTPEALHRFRIAGKKLRYAMELLGGAFPDSLRTEIYPATVSLQDKLGELNDCATAQQRLQHWLEPSKDAEETAYLQALLSDAQRRGGQCREAFCAWWTAERRQLLRQQFEQLLGDRPPRASCA